MQKGLLVSAICVLVAGSAPAGAVTLGGQSVPKDRLIVFLAVGHSNMCGRVDDIDRETYDTEPRAWSFKIDDGSDAWVPARAPVHRDVSWQRGAGPATPFLKQLAADYPGYYFGVIQNAHSSVSCHGDYRRGRAFYDEIVAAANKVKGQATFGGVLCMLGAMEAKNAGQAADFGDQLAGMIAELRQDLGRPDLPLLVNRLTRGPAHWQQVQAGITQLAASDPHVAIVASDGPYKPGDNVHYTWAGEQAWGRAAAKLITTQSWLAQAGDPFAPQLDQVQVQDESTLVLEFDEPLAPATASAAAGYQLTPARAISSASLAADQRTVTLKVAPLTAGTTYTLTAKGVADPAGNSATRSASVTYEEPGIPTAKLLAWLRADRDVIESNGGSVALWGDQSPARNDFIRARFANQPQLVSGALNGKPAIRFGALDDKEHDFISRTLTSAYVGDSTLVAVFRLASTGQVTSAALFASDDQAGSLQSLQIDVDGGQPGNVQVCSAGGYPVGPASTQPMLLSLRVKGTELRTAIDGGKPTLQSVAATEAKRFEVMTLGANRAGSEHALFDLAELVVYRGALSDAELGVVEQHLGKKYGLIAAPPGVTLAPTGGLVTSEAGQQASFTVVLDAPPSATVAVPLSSSDEGEGLPSPSSLTFSSQDWDKPQVVTVSGVDDSVDDGDEDYAIVVGPLQSADGGYQGLDPPDVSVRNLDDDGAVTDLPPAAVIDGPAEAGVGQAATLSAVRSSDDGNIVSYTWDFGDGGTGDGSLVEHSWNSAGQYTVTLRVTDDRGQYNEAQHGLVVTAAPEPSVTLIGPTGGERLVSGSIQPIRWSTVALTDARIDFSSDGGATWSLVDYVDTDDPGWGDYAWTVPDLESEDCLIMVQGYYFEAPARSQPFAITRSGELSASSDPASLPAPGPASSPTLSGGCRLGPLSASEAPWALMLVLGLLWRTRRR